MLLAILTMLAPTLYFASRSSLDLSVSWQQIQKAMQARAMIDLEDDFRSGLRGWQGGADWAKSWALDPSGAVKPGKLALLRQSAGLVDYRMEFLGQIEKKSLSFAFRAVDINNYYAGRLAISRPGPLPTATITRYAVINGREQDRSELPLPMSIRNDTIYRIIVSVQGDSHMITVNGQLVDAWNDNRLPSGGVGFFAEKGASSRLLWVRVVDKDDFLGKACSYFSPRNADIKAPGEKHE